MTPHEKLVADLEALVFDAKAFAFHDFKSEVATPKLYLVDRLQILLQNVKSGQYDNEADSTDKAVMRAELEEDGASEEFLKKLGL